MFGIIIFVGIIVGLYYLIKFILNTHKKTYNANDEHDPIVLEKNEDSPLIPEQNDQEILKQKFSSICKDGLQYCHYTNSCKTIDECKPPARCASDYSQGRICPTIYDPQCNLLDDTTYCSKCVAPQNAVTIPGECEVLKDIYNCKTKEKWDRNKELYCEYENFEGNQFFNIQ